MFSSFLNYANDDDSALFFSTLQETDLTTLFLLSYLFI